MANITFDLFLTHDWGIDEEGRNNHHRVAELNRMLQEAGFQTWFDDERMKGHIVQQMCDGIERSRVVLVFITSRYVDKVNARGEDNCKSEFDYAVMRKGTEYMIPIVMEKSMLDTKKWTGPVCMKLGHHLYIDMTSDKDIELNFAPLVKRLNEMVPSNASPSARVTTSTPANPTVSSPRPVTASSPRSSTSQAKPAAEWDIDETCAWLSSIGLESLHDGFRTKQITGKKLLMLKPESIAKSLNLDDLDLEVLIAGMTELLGRQGQSGGSLSPRQGRHTQSIPENPDAPIIAELSKDYIYIISTYKTAATALLNQPVGTVISFRDGCMKLASHADLKIKSRGLWGLGRHIKGNETVTLADGRVMNEKQLSIEAIKCDSQNSRAYNNLGYTLSGNETVTLADGRVMNNKQLYIEAIKCDSQYSNAYTSLGAVLSGNETVTLADGRVMNKKQLYIEAIKCDSQNSAAYNNLGNALSEGGLFSSDEKVTLHDGRVMTAKQLRAEAKKSEK